MLDLAVPSRTVVVRSWPSGRKGSLCNVARIMPDRLYMHYLNDYDKLHPYARVIVDAAIRRGIEVQVVDPSWGELRLTYGTLTIGTRESLTELTSALALSRCQDKRVTRRVLSNAGLKVARGRTATDNDADFAFLTEVGTAVVKPARGAEGSGVTVGVSSREALRAAIDLARRHCPDVIIEQMGKGEELRVLVIDHKVAAAVLRRPASIIGDGVHHIAELVKRETRRRAAETGGKSRIPMDETTHQVIHEAGYSMDDVLPVGEVLAVRRTANMHTDLRTGGTAKDVTDELHAELAQACVAASQALAMPVTGLDLIVQSPSKSDYFFIEANERPGLSNYTPQPVVDLFLDLLFPDSNSTTKRSETEE